MRELPIFEADGAPALHRRIIGFCYLTNPSSEQDALRALEVLVAENEAMDAGLQSGFGAIGKLVNKHCEKQIRWHRMAGLVLLQMIHNQRERGAPDYGKARFAISEWASTARTKSGRSLPSDGVRLKQLFQAAKPAVHYWAAHEVLEHREQEIVFHDEATFTKLMIAAAAIQFEVFEHDFQSQTDALRCWEPWLVPRQFAAPVASGEIKVSIPAEREEVKRLLDSYRNKVFG